MDTQDFLRIFKDTGALQSGHFELTSGLHSPSYFQCALALQHPKHLEAFCQTIVSYFEDEVDQITAVAAPAVGGIVVGQEVGRQLGIRSIFAERKDGGMVFRRGFYVEPNDVVLVVEDVVTTGGSVQEVVDLIESTGAFVVGIGCVVDRSGGENKLEIPLCSVHSTKAVTYQPDSCPLCMENIPISKPGSRKLSR